MVLNFSMSYFWEDWGKNSDYDNKNFLITEDTSLTFSDVFSLGERLWENLEPGVVLICCQKNAETIIAYIGALRAGMVPLLIGADFNQKVKNNYIFKYQPDYIFSQLDNSYDGYVISNPSPFGGIHIRKNKEGGSINKNLALLLPTSGSTGDPKCVRISHEAINECTKSVCNYLEMNFERRNITTLPIHYSYGLSVLHNSLASRSSLIVTTQSVIEPLFWQTILNNKVTDFAGVPFTFEMLRRFKFTDEILSTLLFVTQAGGKLNKSLSDYYFDLFTKAGVKYFTMYGQTEASPRISYLHPKYAKSKSGSVGKVIDCGKVRIKETGLKSGEGELEYAGPNVCLGYAETRKDLEKGDEFNGVLNTGDIVRIDSDGFIYIIGRRKRFLKLQGVTVNLDYVQEILCSNSVKCVVIGETDKIFILDAEKNPKKIKAILEKEFNFAPSNYRIKAIDTIPTLSSGKINYALLDNEYLKA